MKLVRQRVVCTAKVIQYCALPLRPRIYLAVRHRMLRQYAMEYYIPLKRRK